MAQIEQFPAKHGARFSTKPAPQWISRGSQRSDGGKSRYIIGAAGACGIFSRVFAAPFLPAATIVNR
jgi:hypothetical protein